MEDEFGPNERFSVYQFFEDGSYEEVRHHTDIQDAEKAAKHYCTSVAARIGITKRVIMTDLGDCIVFEWKYGQGVVFPVLQSPSKDVSSKDTQ